MPIPNSLPWMESVDAKIARAQEHLEVLHREIHEFLRATNRKLVVNVDERQSKTWIVYWVEDPYPPIRISVLVGDCVFNVRSALDTLICGLVRTRKPSSSCSGRKFPIYRDEVEYRRNRDAALKGVPEDAAKLVDRFQPCNRPQGTVELWPGGRV